MADPRKIVPIQMKSLIDGVGCYDAVAETINTRWRMVTGQGGASKGTISKKVAGQLDWTIFDVIALQDACGRWPVTRMLALDLENRPFPTCGSLLSGSGRAAKECGEAVNATLAAEQSCGAHETAQAIVEIDEAVNILLRLKATLSMREQE